MSMLGENEDCLLCGAHQPPGHVVVRTVNGSRAGRVCSEHTLREIILDSEERFLVEIEVSEVAFRITERVRVKHRATSAKRKAGEMDDERDQADRVCLELLGWTDLKWSPSNCDSWWGFPPNEPRLVPSLAARPSSSPYLISPLAKALRAKGWHVAVRSCWLSEQWVAQLLHGGREVTEYADTMEGALAMAAAKAVGERSEG